MRYGDQDCADTICNVQQLVGQNHRRRRSFPEQVIPKEEQEDLHASTKRDEASISSVGSVGAIGNHLQHSPSRIAVVQRNVSVVELPEMEQIQYWSVSVVQVDGRIINSLPTLG